MTRVDLIKSLIGDLHRPSVVVALGWGAFIVALVGVILGRELSGLALVVGALSTGAAAMHFGRSWENTRTPPSA